MTVNFAERHEQKGDNRSAKSLWEINVTQKSFEGNNRDGVKEKDSRPQQDPNRVDVGELYAPAKRQQKDR